MPPPSKSRHSRVYEYADPANFVPRRPTQASPTEPPMKKDGAPTDDDDLSEENDDRTETEADNEYASKTALQAIFKYAKKGKLELSLEEGDRLSIIDKTNENWWYVGKEGSGHPKKTGYVPASFVAFLSGVENESWFFGDITRETAESLLMKQAKGTFLMRCKEGAAADEDTTTATDTEGSSKVGGPPVMRHQTYLLSVRSESKANSENAVRHYEVKYDGKRREWYLHEGKGFTTLKRLIEYYKTISPKLAHLCVKLTKPCPQPKTGLMGADSKEAAWELNRQELVFAEKLGAGFFGEVWKATYNSLIPVAVKVLKSDDVQRPQDFLEEAQIMKSLNHPNLVKLIGVCTTAGPIYIVTEFMPNGNLRDYLIRGEGKGFSVKGLLQMIQDVAQGMAYLEMKGVVHRDLACRNILVGFRIQEVPTVKVADFGLAKYIGEKTSNTTDIPVKWSAPEVLQHKIFSTKSDVWSFGILVYEIVTKGKVPYPLLTNAEVNDRVPKGARMDMPSGYPKDLWKLSDRCWRKVPEERPSFRRIADYLKRYDDNGNLRHAAAVAPKARAKAARSSSSQNKTKYDKNASRNSVNSAPKNKLLETAQKNRTEESRSRGKTSTNLTKRRSTHSQYPVVRPKGRK